jgi:hypothetical protein
MLREDLMAMFFTIRSEKPTTPTSHEKIKVHKFLTRNGQLPEKVWTQRKKFHTEKLSSHDTTSSMSKIQTPRHHVLNDTYSTTPQSNMHNCSSSLAKPKKAIPALITIITEYF